LRAIRTASATTSTPNRRVEIEAAYVSLCVRPTHRKAARARATIAGAGRTILASGRLARSVPAAGATVHRTGGAVFTSRGLARSVPAACPAVLRTRRAVLATGCVAGPVPTARAA